MKQLFLNVLIKVRLLTGRWCCSGAVSDYAFVMGKVVLAVCVKKQRERCNVPEQAYRHTYARTYACPNVEPGGSQRSCLTSDRCNFFLCRGGSIESGNQAYTLIATSQGVVHATSAVTAPYRMNWHCAWGCALSVPAGRRRLRHTHGGELGCISAINQTTARVAWNIFSLHLNKAAPVETQVTQHTFPAYAQPPQHPAPTWCIQL